ncbi:hypothetical protein J5X84_25150 [Streptosporangiaceae bacterium NEAU-GS5]|nr:hypothetical protein [Streptosporangiaceae bacterium NEAU-GS5]
MLAPIVLSLALAASGHGWSVAHAGALPAASRLSVVASAGPHDVWVGGKEHGNDYAEIGRAVLEHWDGRRWTVTRLPHADSVVGLSAAGPKDVWAAARQSYEGGGLLYHYDGRRWSRVTGLPAAGDYDVAAVRGAVFVAIRDGSDVLTRDADGWQPATLGEDVHLRAVRARTPADAWAIGGTGDYQTERPFAAHWDGHAWTSTPLPLNTGHLHAVLSYSPENAWAVGNGLRPFKGRYEPYGKPFVLHWDGAAWKQVKVPAGRADLRAITAAGGGRVLIGGFDPAHPSRPFFLRNNNTRKWHADTVKPPRGAKYVEVNGVAAAGYDLWAVGAFDRVKGSPTPRDLVLRYRP